MAYNTGFNMAEFTSHASGLFIYRISVAWDESDNLLREAEVSYRTPPPVLYWLDEAYATLYNICYNNIRCVIRNPKTREELEANFKKIDAYRTLMSIPNDQKPIQISNLKLYGECLRLLDITKKMMSEYMQQFKFWIRTDSNGRGISSLPV